MGLRTYSFALFDPLTVDKPTILVSMSCPAWCLAQSEPSYLGWKTPFRQKRWLLDKENWTNSTIL